MKKFLSILVALSMVLSLFAGALAPRTSAAAAAMTVTGLANPIPASPATTTVTLTVAGTHALYPAAYFDVVGLTDTLSITPVSAYVVNDAPYAAEHAVTVLADATISGTFTLTGATAGTYAIRVTFYGEGGLDLFEQTIVVTVRAFVGVTTVAADPIGLTSATLKGKNGDADATNTTFWYGTNHPTSPFTASATPTAPSGWVDTIGGLGAEAAGAEFSYFLSPLAENTEYHFVAWALVAGTWYPGSILSFKTGTTAAASCTLGGVIIDASGTKKIDAADEITQDYYGVNPTLEHVTGQDVEGQLDTLPDGDYVYNMGDIITGKLTSGTVDYIPHDPWKVTLMQFPNHAVDFTVVSGGVGTFTIGTANVRFDGPYWLHIESLGGESLPAHEWFNNPDEGGACNLYIKYNVAWVLDTITPCPSLQKISGYVTRGNGQTVDVPVFVGVAYPGVSHEGYLASYYSISALSSGQFAMTFLGKQDPGLYRVFLMDGYYDDHNDPELHGDPLLGDVLDYSHGIIPLPAPTHESSFHDGTAHLDHDALVYKTISTIPTAFSMKAALFTSPVYLYKAQAGQSVVIALTDAFGGPVTDALWYVENTAGTVIMDNEHPIDNANITATEIDAGYYKFDISTVGYAGTDLRFFFAQTLYGEDYLSNKLVIDLRTKGAWNPYLQVNVTPTDYVDGHGLWDTKLMRYVYDALPCTIGSGIWLKVGFWPVADPLNYTVPYADDPTYGTVTVKFTGPISYMTSESPLTTPVYDADLNVYYESDTWYRFRITKAGAIGASIDVTMWERQDPAFDISSKNACCKTFSKVFSVCEVKSCTTTSIQLSGGAQTSASAITVDGKADLVVSVDPTGAPADLFCGCNSKIVKVYMTLNGEVIEDAFTVDTYGGGTPIDISELWYNGIPASLGSFAELNGQAKCNRGYSADGTVHFEPTTAGIVAVDNCTTLTFKGVKFNFPTGWTACGTYRLIVEVFGEQRPYDQCGAGCPEYPFISEAVNPISVKPVTVAKTATTAIFEEGIDPSAILAGVPATVEMTDPKFSGATSSDWEDPIDNFDFLFKAAGTEDFLDFDTWGYADPTVSEIDSGYRFSSFCITRAGTVQIYTYSYNTDGDCKKLEELIVEIPVVMPTFTVKLELLDGTIIDSDGILTAGFGETVIVTATDPRADGTHDFTTDLYSLNAVGLPDSCYLTTAVVCTASATGCIGCAGGLSLTVAGYDNPCLEGAGRVRVRMSTPCGNLTVANFTLADAAVAVNPEVVPFTIPASATHVTFTVKDAHGHGAPGAVVTISGTQAPGAGASGYTWTAGTVETGKDPMGEADWAFVPPFSGQYFIQAFGHDICPETLSPVPSYWTSKYDDLGATITAKYQAPVVDTTAPVVTVTAGIDGSTVAADVLALTGKVTDNVGVSQLYVGFNKVDVLPDGSFMLNVKLAQGLNTISVVAYDAAGNKGSAAVKVTFTPPVDNTTVLVLTIGADIVSINGMATSIDAAPEIVASRTFVPLRFIAESFGATVEWLPETQGITITLGEHTLGLQIGNATAVIDGTIVSLPAAPYIKNGRTMVPLRLISEAFGGDVVWDAATRTITITYVP